MSVQPSAHGEAPETVGALPYPYTMSVLALVISSIVVMAFSLLSWAMLSLLEAMGGYDPDPLALMFVPLLALPGAVVGSVASWRTKRHWPFYLGLVVSLLPIVLAFVLPPLFDPSLGAERMD